MKYLSNFVLSWISVTVLYLILISNEATALLAPVVGVVVPYGAFNAVVSLGEISEGKYLSLVGVVLLVVCLLFADQVASKLGITARSTKIAFNLAVLFVLTAVVDFLIWGQWLSIYLLLSIGQPMQI